MQGSSQSSQCDPATSPAVQQFLRDVEAAVALPPHVSPALAAVTTICTLTMRLSAGEARDLLETLPCSLHQLLQPCERLQPEAGEPFNREEFLTRVAQTLLVREPDSERIALAVFGALRARLPVKEVQDVASQLPHALKNLWLEAVPGLAAPDAGPPILIAPEPGHFVLREIEQSGTLPLGVSGPQAFAAVMCTLSQLLRTEDSQRVVRDLPTSVRPLIQRCAVHPGDQLPHVDANDFMLRVAAHLGIDDVSQAEEITRVVFGAAHRLMSAEERDAIARQLPHYLRTIWREPNLREAV
jgi:uncharacterized protein (DUF2267 family)